MPTIADLEHYQGNTFDRPLTISQSNGDPYDLTDATVYFTIKHLHDKRDDDDEALVQLFWIFAGDSEGITVTDELTGVIQVVMDAETVDILTPTTYRYDIQVVRDEIVDTPVRGTFTVTRDTTRRREIL